MRTFADMGNIKRNSTVGTRWSRFGPYYAMFPVEFAFNVVKKHSKKGDFILDPFAGRCSSVFAAAALDRHGIGIEINPVGWVYGKVKLNPAEKKEVVDRLLEIYGKRNYYNRAIQRMPEFYRMCYCDEVLKFLLSVKENLDWRNNHTDATLMAIILVYLHGKIGEGLSNQMRMTKSMGINYSVQWWKKNNLTSPPEINPYIFLHKRIHWRYEKGIPTFLKSNVRLGNSEEIILTIQQKFSLLFTSPPYYSITNYHADQWLRLWLLNFEPTEKHQSRFTNKQEYYNLLNNVFKNSSKLMKQKSTVYIRTDKREFTFNTTLEVLKKHFPKHNVITIERPLTKDTKTQTKLFGDNSLKPGEIDIILNS